MAARLEYLLHNGTRVSGIMRLIEPDPHKESTRAQGDGLLYMVQVAQELQEELFW